MTNTPGIAIVYDGKCPFCTRYARLLRLRETAGPVRLIDARSGDQLVAALTAAGYDLDQGMAAQYGGRIYYGDECVHLLSLLSTPSGAVNRLMKALFSTPRLSRVFYPVMVFGRNATLRFLGHRKIADER
jgi:predicted DCC family thiol-disulfide oxidoreductase YuxK